MFTLLSKYDPSVVSNPRDERSRFVTGFFDLVNDQCRKDIVHYDMNLSRIMMYAH